MRKSVKIFLIFIFFYPFIDTKGQEIGYLCTDYKERLSTKKFPQKDYLTCQEILLLISDSAEHWSEFTEIANQRALNDSVKYWNTYWREVHRFQSNIPLAYITEEEEFEQRSYGRGIMSIYKNRLIRQKLESFPNVYYLDYPEVLLLLIDSANYWSKYMEIVNKRILEDSVRYWTEHLNDEDIIYPIDSVLPFGPKSLEYLIKTNQKEIEFTALAYRDLTDEKELKNRKLIHETWIYYLAFHPYIDEENLIWLPKIMTYQYIDLDKDKLIKQNAGIQFSYFDKDDKYYFKKDESDYYNYSGLGYLAARISNIRGYEVYYSATGTYPDYGCAPFGKSAENCCFSDEYACASRGHLIFYDRKKQHSIIIPVYGETPYYECELSFRFFYVSKDNTIHIFEGSSSKTYYDRISWESPYEVKSKSARLAKTHEIKITKDKEFIIDKITQIDSKLPFGAESLEHLIETNQNTIEFTVPAKQDLTDKEELLNRALINETWGYYLKFHPYAGKYPKNLPKTLPKISTYQYVNLNKDKKIKQNKGIKFNYLSKDSEHNYNDKMGLGYLAARIPDIQGYEVYYSATGKYDDSDAKCITYNPSNICCFRDDYECYSKGSLVFYDRKKQHSIIIPVYGLNPDANCGFSFRFFYVSKDNTIHIFDGCSSTCYRSEDDTDCAKHVYLSKAYEVKITKDKEFIINKIIANN